MLKRNNENKLVELSLKQRQQWVTYQYDSLIIKESNELKRARDLSSLANSLFLRHGQ